jgi:hypothetical protein
MRVMLIYKRNKFWVIGDLMQEKMREISKYGSIDLK